MGIDNLLKSPAEQSVLEVLPSVARPLLPILETAFRRDEAERPDRDVVVLDRRRPLGLCDREVRPTAIETFASSQQVQERPIREEWDSVVLVLVAHREWAQ